MGKVLNNIHTKICQTVKDGMTIMVGGFGLCGIPENAISALVASGAKDLTIISNNFGIAGFGLDMLLNGGQLKKLIASYVAGNSNIQQKYISGEILLELMPQGTLAERIRAGGAGIAAFYTPTGIGTIVEEGKEVREFEGKKYLMERSLKADIALIKGSIGDTEGNIVYHKTTRNFNPIMATAANVTIAEVEKLVDVGDLDADIIHTPGIYVDYIAEGKFEKRIENLTLAVS